jgi:hypothetical protein
VHDVGTMPGHIGFGGVLAAAVIRHGLGTWLRRGFVVLVLAALSSTASASGSSGSLVGTWTRVTTCAEQLNAIRSWPGLAKYASEMVVGNGFLPGVQSVDQLQDHAHPCRGAVPRRHSHFFTADGTFGSLDWRGQAVDDGTFRVKGDRLVISKEFPSVTFAFSIHGSSVTFRPLISRPCSTFRCAWSLAMAFPGKPWHRAGS